MMQSDLWRKVEGAMAVASKELGTTSSERPARVLLLVGSETGNAAIAADAIETVLSDAGLDVHMVLDDASPKQLVSCQAVLVCTSSHGSGDIPDNLLPFCEALEREAPSLESYLYGVIALGDRNYQETFCGAGRTVDRLFAGLKARAVLPRLEIDANEHPIPDPVAADWTQSWVAALETAICTGSPGERTATGVR